MSRPLLRFGIDVREASLAQEAFNLGLIDNVKAYGKINPELKRAVRAQALMSKAFKDSSDAVGDLERTQGSYANTSRRTSEQVKEFGETLGGLLQPQMQSVVKLFGEGAKAATDFIKALTATTPEKTIVEKQIEFLEQFVLGFRAEQEVLKTFGSDLTDNMDQLLDKTFKFTVAQEDINSLKKEGLKIDEDSSILGKKDIIDLDEIFDQDFRIKNILEEQLGTRELSIQAIEKAIVKLKEQKDIEGKADPGVEDPTDKLNKKTKERNILLNEMRDFERELNKELSKKDEILTKELENIDKLFEAENQLNEDRKRWADEQDEIDEKREKIKDNMVGYNAELVGSFATLFQTFSKESSSAFAAYKAFAIAETLISTYAAAQKQFEALSLFPPAAYAAAATAVVAGLAKVALIQQQEYQGRQFGGNVEAGRPHMVGEHGREVFIPNLDGFIIPNNMLNKLGGGHTIQVNAVMDAEAFKMLLRNGGNQVIQGEIFNGRL